MRRNIKEGEMTIQKDISERVRTLRKEQDWSLEKLAQMSGLSKGYLSMIENREKNPTISTLVKIALGLGVSIDYLITGNQRPSPPTKMSMVRAHERERVSNPWGTAGYLYESLVFKKNSRTMDGFILTIGPGGPDDPQVHDLRARSKGSIGHEASVCKFVIGYERSGQIIYIL